MRKIIEDWMGASYMGLTSSKKKFIVLLLLIPIFAPIVMARYTGTHTVLRDVDCAKCHSDIVTEQQSSTKAVHRNMACSNCHIYSTPSEFHKYQLPTDWGAMSAVCGNCHSDEYTDWQAGGHSSTAECWMCHTEYTPSPS